MEPSGLRLLLAASQHEAADDEQQHLDDGDRDAVEHGGAESSAGRRSASISPYIDASRGPRPDGAKTASTATIAPTAAVPPRKTIDAASGCAPTDRSSSQSAEPPITHVPE